MLGIRHWSLSVGAAVALLASASTLSAQTTKSDARGKASNAAGSDPAAKGDAETPDQQPQGPWNDPAGQLRRLKMMVGGMPGGPGGGRGGPGGPGGPGGGTNGMVTLLLSSEALQEEIALTDEQKAKLQEVRETADKARREMFTQMRNNGGQQGGGRGGNNGGQPGGGRGGNNGQPGGGRGGNNGQPGGGRGGNINFQAMGEMMAQLNQKTEASIGKILDKAQKDRLNQIELRIIGVTAVARPDVAKKLNVTPPQSAQIQAVMDQMQVAQREQRDQMMQQMRGAFGGQGGRGGNAGQPGGGRGGNADPNAGGNNNGGGGRGNRPDFNSPEMREMMTKMTDDAERMEKEVEKGIAKVLTKNQKAKFNSMLGAEYDLTKLAASLGGNRGGRGGDRTQARNGAATKGAAPENDGDR